MMSKVETKSIFEVSPADLPEIDMASVDPPWGQAKLTYFSNKTKSQAPSWMSFLRQLVQLLQRTKGAVYVEIGMNWLDDLLQVIDEKHGKVLRQWEITYFGKRPATLVLCAWSNCAAPNFNFNGLDDQDTPFEAINHSSVIGDVVFDPCTGHGLTARAAISQHRRFYGLEINKDRAAEVMKVIGELHE